MKKSLVLLCIVVFTLIVGYFFLRFYFLRVPDFTPDQSRSASIIDLRPAIIAKLRQMVKDGSNGLYKLSVESVEADILASRFTATNAILSVDSFVLKRMDSMHLAPDEVFHISFQSLRINEMGITDFLSTKAISLQSIYLNEPVIEVYRKKKDYNKEKRLRTDSMTLYQRLTMHTKSIKIDTILIKHGSFASFNQLYSNKNTKLNQIAVQIDNLLIDSTTQFDAHRFFFAEKAEITCGHVLRRTADSLYFFSADTLSVSVPENTLTVKNVSLIPRGNKKEFQKKLVYRNDRFELNIPRIIFKNVDWWSLVNHENFNCDEADTYKGTFQDYVNDLLPSKPNIRIANFPLQLMMKLSLPLQIKKMNVHHLDFLYEEYYPPSGKTGALFFDDINATATNISNSRHKTGRRATLKGTTLFMHEVPLTIAFSFDIPKWKTGEFILDLHLAKMEASLVNPATEALALFSISNGSVHGLTAHITGNNYHAGGNMTLLYDDLHINPLKKNTQAPGHLKKRPILGFIANTFFIKNSNPNKKDIPRIPVVSVERGHSGSFFNFVWKAIQLAILKTVGIPESYGLK